MRLSACLCSAVSPGHDPAAEDLSTMSHLCVAAEASEEISGSVAARPDLEKNPTNTSARSRDREGNQNDDRPGDKASDLNGAGVGKSRAVRQCLGLTVG